ncbi:polysaccharide deacetylase family protein [uncultured Clostridium sp.]|uniref:polysaccharide deacetylase family protein n=1 Tax=uncultured Clostridium sp. TaxID=59620 RepID=UPI00262F0CE9|nr:polysaccharide deacetylase family protein [uncultured Clostridium sp.]
MVRKKFKIQKTEIRLKIIKRRRVAALFIIGILSVGIISIALFKEKEEVVVAEEKLKREKSEEIKKKEFENNQKDIEKEQIYLSLKDDPFADDAKKVEKDLKDLITGKRNFPIRTDGKKVAYLTFDDGPSNTVTPEILKILKEENIKGTFFVLGSKVNESEENKELVKKIAKNGHALANHTYSHDYRKLYPKGEIKADYFLEEVRKTNRLLKDILGESFDTRVVRFPGGYWSWNGREEARKKLDEAGICSVDWNALNGDAEGVKISASNLNKRLKESFYELGDKADNIVVLMHDTNGKETTAESLRETINFLKKKGFEFRTIK